MAESPAAARTPSSGIEASEAGDGLDGRSLSLEEILDLYNQPINEEQAWAVCYQCCASMRAGSGETGKRRKITGASEIRIRRDGAVTISQSSGPGASIDSRCTETEVIVSLGVIIYKALDYGLKDNEERELSPPLERLIDNMTNVDETDGSNDEGYDALDEEDEDASEKEVPEFRHSYRNVMKLCSSHLPTPSEAPNHYQAVCRALYAETMELHTFLSKIKSAKESLKKIQQMERGTTDRSCSDLDDLKNADWARFWVQVMRDLRNGVKLKKVQERHYDMLPIEFELTPYEMLMDDIRFKRYTLKKVMVQGDIPPRLKKSAHEIILDFIRSRPPLNPVSARKLKPTPPRPRSLHERILEEIKSERKLRPVSPDEIRRSRLDVCTPEVTRKLPGSTVLNGDVTDQARTNGRSLQVNVQRKRLLKAPTLAELDSSESEEDTVQVKSSSSSSMSNSQPEDISPGTIARKKIPPRFLPISSTPQPERRQTPQRRHSIEKETPTNVRQFLPPSRQSSRSLVPRITSFFPRMAFRPPFSTLHTASLLGSHPFEAAICGAAGAMFYLFEKAYASRWRAPQEEFCYPVECLALTVEEVMHIRQVLVKAELEKYQQYKEVYNALKKGKLCLCCRTKRFSLFTWSYTCQFCKRPVCSQCCKKMRLPSKPYSTLPIFSLGPSTLQRGDSFLRPEKPSTSHHRPLRSLPKLSSKKSVDKSEDELQFPKELMEDWSTMEVCVDCKKFISDIISSSRRSLTLANKRARLKRKTQSFYLSSTATAEFRPTERTINEI
ncbi:protein spire homolog 1 isoform X2 [Mixophyes fleayi]|uniref:protein spire homolog 1 isoform X2 n=1 Tax=Mixophyes fleayi TaxID=3061075 RepID=UPI003F4DC291